MKHDPAFLDECLAYACCVTAWLVAPWSVIGALALFVCAMSFFISANSFADTERDGERRADGEV